ncbi:zinc ribbon domain-containing protein [Lacrimispora sp.]|uniref:zinc ribbon domain-containing protein n=1 Tax=Lacrimispora sp. TaxID=2719234 RepID=UPI002FDB4CE8
MALVKCPECGQELEEGLTVCSKCGCSVKHNENKKNRKTIIIACACLAIVIFVGSIGGFINNSDPIKKYISLFNKNKNEEAVEVYNSKIAGNNELLEKLSLEQNSNMDDIYTRFKDGKILYDDAIEDISIYTEYEASKKYAIEVQTKIEALKSSRKAYEDAEKAQSDGDIKTALTKYKAVIEEDNNYIDASKKLKDLTESYKTELLNEAENLSQNKEYKDAIANVDKVISVIGSSDELTELKQKYSDMKSEQYAKIVVVDKSATPKDTSKWLFNDYVNMVFEITNNSDKDIKGIEGALTISDLFGKEILRVGCDFTGNTIKMGETHTESDLSYECNPFIDEDMKFFNTDYNDLQFSYDILSIVFSDGSTIVPE